MPKGSRRGWGEGSVFQRKDGYWVASVAAGRCRGGHPRKDGTVCRGGERRRLRVVRRTKKEVLAELGRLKDEAEAGAAGGGHITIDQFSRWWLDNVKAGNVSDVTLERYQQRIDNWIVPHLGHVRLTKLGVDDVQTWMNQLARNGLGPSARNDARVCLAMILKYAVGARKITFNPVEHVAGPKHESKTDDTLTLEQSKAVLAAAEGDRLEALYVMCLKYGLRQGELLALTWGRVDLDAAVLKVGKAKTRAGVRDLPLLAGSVEALKAHRRRQAVERLEAGPLWRDSDLVFCQANGAPITSRRLREFWAKLLDDAGVPRRRFHASRHTAATLLLEAGVELEVVSAILGHANIGITADIYAKVRADLKRKGLSKLDDVGG